MYLLQRFAFITLMGLMLFNSHQAVAFNPYSSNSSFSSYQYSHYQPSRRHFDGAVYVMSNRSDRNTIIAFGRLYDGTLKKIGEYRSGGAGTGPLHPPSLSVSDANDPLISADAVRISRNGKFVLAVNSLSHTISSFRIRHNFSLKLIDTIESGGQFPNSVAEYDGKVFVTNIGEVYDQPEASPIDAINANVSGYILNQRTGKLKKTAISESLSTEVSRPSNIQFSENGKVLVVSEIVTGNFISWTLSRNGTLSSRQVFSGNTLSEALNGEGAIVNANPLGLRIVPGTDQNFIVVTEAREAPTFATGSVSIYGLNEETGAISTISQGIVSPGQETTCWLTFNDDYSLFYTANSRTNSISSFRFDPSNGTANLLQADEVVRIDPNGNPASAPIDITSSSDGKYVYQLFGRVGVIGVYEINPDGSLELIQELDGKLPDVGTQGMAAW